MSASAVVRSIASTSRQVMRPWTGSAARHEANALARPTPPLAPRHPSRRLLAGHAVPPSSARSAGISSRSLHTSSPRWASRYDRFPTRSGSGGGWEPQPPPPSGRGSGPSEPGRPGQGRFGGNSPVVMLLRRRLGGDRGLMLFAVAGTGAVVYYVVHLERVPETGRWRFIDVSPASESAIALQTVQETLSQYQGQLLPASSPITKQVRRVAKRIVESNGLGTMREGHGALKGVKQDEGGWVSLPGLGEVMMGGGGGGEAELDWTGGDKGVGAEGKNVEWEVYVIKDDKTKNAFVLPGGKIFVFTGILPVCKNDDGLASVLGHEVAHQVARHSAERLSSAKVLFALGYALEILGLDIGISRILLTFLLQLPNSRKSESEADYIGVKLMSKACFDPRESTRMWTRMSESEKGGSLGGTASIDFLSTHPANDKRIKALEKWMPEALDVRAASPCGDTSSQYEAFREHLPQGPSERVWA